MWKKFHFTFTKMYQPIEIGATNRTIGRHRHPANNNVCQDHLPFCNLKTSNKQYMIWMWICVKTESGGKERLWAVYEPNGHYLYYKTNAKWIRNNIWRKICWKEKYVCSGFFSSSALLDDQIQRWTLTQWLMKIKWSNIIINAGHDERPRERSHQYNWWITIFPFRCDNIRYVRGQYEQRAQWHGWWPHLVYKPNST